MTRKLEDLFDLPTTAPETDSVPAVNETRATLAEIDAAIDKIDAALPAVNGLDVSDNEMDELASLAQGSYKDLMDLGMNVDSRFASEIFSVASNMLGHAITAKTAKMNKKIKMIELQMKKAKLDNDLAGEEQQTPNAPNAQGHVLNRNDILDRLLSSTRDQKANKA
jgi:hypothetical protein